MKKWLNRWSRSLKRRGLSLPKAPAELLFPGGAPLKSRNGQMAAYQGWVFAAVNAISRRIAGMPLRLYLKDETGRGPEITSHPLLKLLASPNPLFTGRQMRSLLVIHLELTGMAFLLKVKNRLGEPAELWPLSPADLVEIKPGTDTGRPIEAFVFRTRPGGPPATLPKTSFISGTPGQTA